MMSWFNNSCLIAPLRVERLRASTSTVTSFFFSSRRRHTRFDCDWSSDVCSSDLCEGISRQEMRISLGIPRLAQRTRRSEEHTSELQSQSNLVCRLLLEKKNYIV